MMIISEFLNEINTELFTGVPDSKLKALCNYLIDNYGTSESHIIAANEGNAVAIAAGYHLATGKTPLVYLQNSGLGNIINPVASLLNERVYGIPCIFVIGWRGEPGLKDEPQHAFQGEITPDTLKLLDIVYMVIDSETSLDDLRDNMSNVDKELSEGKSFAFIVKKDGLVYEGNPEYKNDSNVSREEIIEAITTFSKEDIIVSTTGKTSRELFEIREKAGVTHKYDFLTVGSMGHSSSIALGIALSKPNKRVWCIDGDGSALMHMGSMGIIGSLELKNLIHLVINNGSHESVGGQPTAGDKVDFEGVARACNYKNTYKVETLDSLKEVLSKVKELKGPIFIEVNSAIGSRDDLGRPTISPKDNKISFMENLLEDN